eukprot:5567925-Prymnesium_polylepis.1
MPFGDRAGLVLQPPEVHSYRLHSRLPVHPRTLNMATNYWCGAPVGIDVCRRGRSIAFTASMPPRTTFGGIDLAAPASGAIPQTSVMSMGRSAVSMVRRPLAHGGPVI